MSIEFIGEIGMDGKGFFFRVAAKKDEFIDIDGNMMVEILIIPSEAMKYFYNIKNEDLETTTPAGFRGTWKTYPKEYFHRINENYLSDVCQWVLFCTYRGDENTALILTKRAYTEKITAMQGIIESQKATMLMQKQELVIMASNVSEIFRYRKQVEEVMSMPEETTTPENSDEVGK
jgi:hypothetical protein